MATKDLNFESYSLTSSVSNPGHVSYLSRAKEYVLSVFELSLAEVPEVMDISKVYYKLVSSIGDVSYFSTISRREERLVPWALLQTIEDTPLFEQPGALDVIGAWLINEKRSQCIPGFIQAFLSEYPAHSRQFYALKMLIRNLLSQSDSPKNQKLKLWTEEVELFSGSVIQKFSRIAIDESIAACISTYRLHRGLDFGNFFKVGLQSVLTKLIDSLSTMESGRQVIVIDDLLKTFVNDAGDFNYPALKTDFAEGLLLSYQRKPPPKRLKDRLKKLFLKHYGDPRISKSGWTGVSEEAVNVMRAWMVENTMHDFFNLLSHVAKTDSTADHHWQYRKRFWNAYLKKGVIQEAWVALGSRANDEAKSFLSDNSSFATLVGGAPNHSSLIMVIGDVMVTEWSHSGKYRVWRRDLGRPKLYKRTYRRSELVNGCDYDGAHHSSDSGGWQYKLSSLLNDLTGISVSSRDYMNDR